MLTVKDLFNSHLRLLVIFSVLDAFLQTNPASNCVTGVCIQHNSTA